VIDFKYIESQGELDQVTAAMEQSSRVAVDTEADSLHSYKEKVCLIQLRFKDKNYLIDPLIELDLSGFLKVLTGKQLIFHGADYDLRMLRQSYGFVPQKEIFDTMIAAQLLGLPGISLQALVQDSFEVTLSKKGQRSDWSRRPLTKEQLVYAAADTFYLGRLAERLEAGLKEKGRLGWFKEWCEKLVEVTAVEKSVNEEDLWRIKGISRLKPQELNFVRALWYWRDQQARRKDVPVFKIMNNEQLIELALSVSGAFTDHPKDFLKRAVFPKYIRGERLAVLNQSLERAAELSPSEWPQPRRKTFVPMARAQKQEVAQLRERLTALAEKLELPLHVIAPRALVEQIVIHQAHSEAEMVEASPIMKWQAALVASCIKD